MPKSSYEQAFYIHAFTEESLNTMYPKDSPGSWIVLSGSCSTGWRAGISSLFPRDRGFPFRATTLIEGRRNVHSMNSDCKI